MGDLGALVVQLMFQLLDLVNVLRLLLAESPLQRLALLAFLSQLLFQLADLGRLLLRDELALVPFLGAAAELVLHLTELVLRLLLLAEHGLQLAFLVLARRLVLLPQRLQLLRETLLLRGQLVRSRLGLAELLLELGHICLTFYFLKHLISLLG